MKTTRLGFVVGTWQIPVCVPASRASEQLGVMSEQ
jgi:hypothetical protein